MLETLVQDSDGGWITRVVVPYVQKLSFSTWMDVIGAGVALGGGVQSAHDMKGGLQTSALGFGLAFAPEASSLLWAYSHSEIEW